MSTGREGATRYFLVEIFLLLIPAAAGFVLLTEYFKEKKKNIPTWLPNALLCVFVVIQLAQTFRPRSYKKFIRPMAGIVARNHSQHKYVYGKFNRINYYAGIRQIIGSPHKVMIPQKLNAGVSASDIYLATYETQEELNSFFNGAIEFELLYEHLDRKKRRIFLYQGKKRAQ